MATDKERTSISGRHATGNTHHRATRKKPKEECPIQKMQKEKTYWRRANKGHQKYVGINAWPVFAAFVFSLSACSIASSIKSRLLGFEQY